MPAGTAVRPLEKLVVPAELDGSEGRFRAPVSQCQLKATNDHEAVRCWLASKRPSHGGDGACATERAYRKEAERLLLWCVLERKEALSSLSTRDAAAFRDFLASPPPAWCGPRYHQRWSPLW